MELGDLIVDDVKKLSKEILSLPREVSIVTHRNADVDAVSSSIGLKRLLSRIGIESNIVVPDTISKSARAISQEEEIQFSQDEVREFSIVLDTSSTEHVSPIQLPRRGIVIDHHSSQGDLSRKYKTFLFDRDSLSMVILDLWKEFGMKPDRETVLILLSGILSDTGNFRFSSAETLIQFGKYMMEYEIRMHEIRDKIEVKDEDDLSLRMAKLKGAQRMEIHRLDDLIVAITEVSSFGGEVAKSLVKLGADISFVISELKEEIRISSRCRDELSLSGRVNSGEIIRMLSVEFGGGGGGHSGAAGLILRRETSKEKLKKRILEIIREIRGLK